MALSPGTQIGPYEVSVRIGAGGMGEVYRARDTRLKRDVALKVLPTSFEPTADRLARFRREAEVLASLNHPHIAQVHGLEESGGTLVLVMELVDGESLSDRIARGAIPLDDALPLARQLCEALDSAHTKNVVHRDLKPANIQLRPDGTLKVLDFGLAKLADPGLVSAVDASLSPTITSPAMLTNAGMILGTAAYMSPEQARGRPVDKRADIWAFGCVLFEMLSGGRAFTGEEVSDTLAEVLKGEPRWTALPAGTPEPILRLLRRCLAKEPKRRLPDIAAAILDLDEALAAPALPAARPIAEKPRRPWLAWSVAATWALAAVALAFVHFREQPPEPEPPVRFSVVTPAARNNPNNIAVSPDGRFVVFTGFDEKGARSLWLRPLDAVAPHPIPGTAEGLLPFWSPNSKSIGFFADAKLKRIDIGGGTAQTLADAPASNPGGSWNRDNVILFGGPDGLFQVPAGGGSPQRVTSLDTRRNDVAHNLPDFLPDGRRFLFFVRSSESERSGIYVGSLDGGPSTHVLDSLAKAEFVSPGYILYLRDGALLSRRFDAETLALTGEQFQLLEQVSYNASNGQAAFSAADGGTLAYRAAAAGTVSRLEWRSREGSLLSTVGENRVHRGLELSPDGSRGIVGLRDPVRGAQDQWLLDVGRGVWTRLTFAAGDEVSARWSPRGDRIAFGQSTGRTGIYTMASTGAGEPEFVLPSTRTAVPDSWSPDGRWLLYEVETARLNWDLWVLPLSPGGKPWPLLEGKFREEYGRFSPDGQWVAYQSTESGRSEIYVTPFVEPDGPATARGAKWQISGNGGSFVRWSRDGRMLYFLAPDGQLMAADVVSDGTAFKVNTVRPLFSLRTVPVDYPYDVAPDGRVLVAAQVDAPGSESIQMIVNWTRALGRGAD